MEPEAVPSPHGGCFSFFFFLITKKVKTMKKKGCFFRVSLPAVRLWEPGSTRGEALLHRPGLRQRDEGRLREQRQGAGAWSSGPRRIGAPPHARVMGLKSGNHGVEIIQWQPVGCLPSLLFGEGFRFFQSPPAKKDALFSPWPTGHLSKRTSCPAPLLQA